MIPPIAAAPTVARAIYGLRLAILSNAGIAKRINETTPFTSFPSGVKKSAAAPSKVGHQSFKNLPITFTFFSFLGSANHFMNLLNANPSSVN